MLRISSIDIRDFTVVLDEGFLEECRCKYSKAVYQKFHSVFAKLPLAYVILPTDSDPEPLLKGPWAFASRTLLLKQRLLIVAFQIAAERCDPRIARGVGIFVLHGGLFRNVDGSVGKISTLQGAKRHVKDPQCRRGWRFRPTPSPCCRD